MVYNVNPAFLGYGYDDNVAIEDPYSYPCDEAFNNFAFRWFKNLDTQNRALTDFYKTLWQLAWDNQPITNHALPPARGVIPAMFLLFEAITDCFFIGLQALNALVNGAKEREFITPLKIIAGALMAPVFMLLAAILHSLVKPVNDVIYGVKKIGNRFGLFIPIAQAVPVPVEVETNSIN